MSDQGGFSYSSNAATLPKVEALDWRAPYPKVMTTIPPTPEQISHTPLGDKVTEYLKCIIHNTYVNPNYLRAVQTCTQGDVLCEQRVLQRVLEARGG